MKTCLVVDNSIDESAQLADMVEYAGFKHISVQNAEQAIYVLEKVEIDIILLEWYLPGMNGLEFARKIKNNKLGENIMILLHSTLDGAKGEQIAVKASYSNYFENYIAKPASQEKVTQTLHEVL